MSSAVAQWGSRPSPRAGRRSNGATGAVARNVSTTRRAKSGPVSPSGGSNSISTPACDGRVGDSRAKNAVSTRASRVMCSARGRRGAGGGRSGLRAGDREQLVERGPEAADEFPRVGNGHRVGQDAQVELVAIAPDGEVERRAVGELPGGEPAIHAPAAEVPRLARARHVGHDYVLERVEAALGPRVDTR